MYDNRIFSFIGINIFMNVTKKDRQFIELCESASKIFSTCAKKQYAAILVDGLNHIVGFGYNGGPSNHLHCKDGGCPRYLDNSQNGSFYDNCIAIHAEANAMIHSDYSSNAEKLYVNGPPCFSCAKLIANSKVKKVYYITDPNYVYTNWNEIETFLQKSNIETIEVLWQHQS